MQPDFTNFGICPFSIRGNFYLSFFWDCFRCTDNDGYNYYIYILHSLILLQRLHIYQVSLYLFLSVLFYDFPKEEYILNNIYFLCAMLMMKLKTHTSAFLNMSHNNFSSHGLEFLFTVVAILRDSGQSNFNLFNDKMILIESNDM